MLQLSLKSNAFLFDFFRNMNKYSIETQTSTFL
jgi:hypothetical protein